MLNIWHIVKGRAEVWSVSGTTDSAFVETLKTTIKNNFKQLSLQKHPDVGGNHDEYVRIQEAYNTLKDATLQQFILALGEEKISNVVLFKPGSDNCMSCAKWSGLLSSCTMSVCSGFKELQRPSMAFPFMKQSNLFA